MPRLLRGSAPVRFVGELAERTASCQRRDNTTHHHCLPRNGDRSLRMREIADRPDTVCLTTRAYIHIRIPRTRLHRTREVRTIVRSAELRNGTRVGLPELR